MTIDFKLSLRHKYIFVGPTGEPGGVDIVGAVVVSAGAEEDPVAVGGQEVRAPEDGSDCKDDKGNLERVGITCQVGGSIMVAADLFLL